MPHPSTNPGERNEGLSLSSWSQRPSSRLLGVALTATVLACLGAPGGASAQAVEIPCSLAETIGAPPGVVVTDEGGISVVAPGLGEGAGVADYRTDGTETLDLYRPQAGLLEVTDCGSDLEVGGAAAAGSPSACDDDHYKLQSFIQYGAYSWRFNANTTPSEISQTNAEDGMREGVKAIEDSNNDCGLADNVSANHSYLGGSNLPASRCASGNSDGVNVVDFGGLEKKALARACWLYVDHAGPESADEVDIRFNKADYRWTKGGGGTDCNYQFSVRGVMTHEAGHAFGLRHVGEQDHGHLTMSPRATACQESEYTLGKGDVFGLRFRY